MSDPIRITKEIVNALHLRQLAEHGGDAGLRDEALWESAPARPQQRYAYEPSSDVFALAAAYAADLARNHPLVDGNKRMAFVTYSLFLPRNGCNLNSEKADRYLTTLHLAAGEMDEVTFAD